jgi:hypothetical protein
MVWMHEFEHYMGIYFLLLFKMAILPPNANRNVGVNTRVAVGNASGPKAGPTQVGKSVTEKATEMINGAKNAAKSAFASDKGPLIIIIAVTVLLLVFVIIYITFSLKSSSLKGKELVKDPIRLDKVEQPIKVANGDIPPTTVGREYSFAFWLYADSYDQLIDSATGDSVQRLIFYRGNANDVTAANPIVMMDGKSNKLHFILKTQASVLDSTTNNNLNSIVKNNFFENKSITSESLSSNKHIIMTVDYVPLQRWVHLVGVVDNKLITLYMDGEIYSVKSIDEFKASRVPEIDRLGRTVDYNLIIEKTDGDVYIGKNSVGQKITLSGFLGRLEFFNYAVTMDDVRKSYEKGPVGKSWLSFLGIQNYGVRAPIYKLDG